MLTHAKTFGPTIMQTDDRVLVEIPPRDKLCIYETDIEKNFLLVKEVLFPILEAAPPEICLLKDIQA